MVNEGMIPDEADAETSDTGNAEAPDAGGFNVLASVMSYGRKKHRLPEQMFANATSRPIPPKPGTVAPRPDKFDPRDFLPGGPGTKMTEEDDNDDTGTQMFATGGGVEGLEDEQPEGGAGAPMGQAGAMMDEDAEHEQDQRFEQVPQDQERRLRFEQRERQRIQDEDYGGKPSGRTPGKGGQAMPPTTMAYLQGSDAMPPDMVQALEASVDPEGMMDPGQRKQKALEAAGSPDKQWGLMQHYRQKFNAYNAFAQAAMEGGGGRPPNPQAAVDAANKAYDNLPDGKKLQFEPVQGGVKVRIQDLSGQELMNALGAGRGRANGLPPQRFEEGGAVEDEYVAPEQDQGVLPDPETTGTVPEQEQGPIQKALGGKRPDQALKEFVLSIPQYLGFLKKGGQFDSVADKGPEAALAEAQASQPEAPQAPQAPQAPPAAQPQGPTRDQQNLRMERDTRQATFNQRRDAGEEGYQRTPVNVPDPENYTLKDVLHEIDQQYPFVGMSDQRAQARREAIQQWMANRTKVEAEQTKGQGALERARVTGQYGIDRAHVAGDTKLQGIDKQQAGATQRVHDSGAVKERIATGNQDAAMKRTQFIEANKNDRNDVINRPGLISNKDKIDAARKARGGSDPNQMMQAPAPQQGQPRQQAQKYQPAPEAAKRQAGTTYQTPKGPLTWTGTGWLTPSQ